MEISSKYPIIAYNGTHYNYAIDALHFGTFNLIHFAAMLNVEMAQALEMIGNLGGYVYNLNGYIYFRNREDAGDFLRFLEEYKDNLN